MDGTIWKDLLDRMGCLQDGHFVPPTIAREVFIAVAVGTDECAITLRRDRPAPADWSYTDDFLIHNDNKGHTRYHAWHAVVTVGTNEA